jgi:hypothetical protein
MRLAKLAEIALSGNEWGTYSGSDISCPLLKVEYFMPRDKVRYSLRIDEQFIPFAVVERGLFRSYVADIKILPCMIPQAQEALSTWMMSGARAGGHTNYLPHDEIRRTEAVQKGLLGVLNSAISERQNFSKNSGHQYIITYPIKKLA